jgi:hypothetical protein
MLRGFLGVIAGLVVGALATGGGEGLGHFLYPLPEGTDVYDPEVQKTLMNIMPLEARIAVVLAWAFGIFMGCMTAIMIAQRQSWPAWVTAGLLFAFALSTMVVIPHPDWMLWAATAGTLVSAILAAYIFARS